MISRTWFENPDHVVYAVKDEVISRLSRELGISELAQRMEDFSKAPHPGGGKHQGAQTQHLEAAGSQPGFPGAHRHG